MHVVVFAAAVLLLALFGVAFVVVVLAMASS